MLNTLLSGAAFGTALTAVGIYQPAVILSQMRLENWHMVQAFLTATGTSTLIVALCQRQGLLSTIKPRSYASLGFAGPLDGNVIGGCLLGVGMTLTGSCPGSVFTQVGVGVYTGIPTLFGCVLGGILYSGFVRSALASIKEKSRETTLKNSQSSLTVHEALGISRSAAVISVAAACASGVAAISALGLVSDINRTLVGPILGGLLVACAQLFSALTRGALLGTSGSFEECGDYISWIIARGGGRDEKTCSKPTSYSAMMFVTGMAVGAFGLSLTVPLALGEEDMGMVRLVGGGVLMTLGSRIAGGCTSGHGITGVSLLSISSVVTVIAMFVGAFGVGALI